MKQGYSHITLVCDRSGSMQSVQSDAEGAVNQFITDQKAVPGEATLLLVDFDAPMPGSESETWFNAVHDGILAAAPTYRLKPRGNTALLDAVGRAITDTGERLAALTEDERPEHVYFVVQTDGMENSSRDFTLDSVREMVKRQTDEYNWQFVFLGMGPDAFGQGHQLGFTNVTRSAHAPAAYGATYDLASNVIAAHRGGQAATLDATNADVDEEGTVTPA